MMRVVVITSGRGPVECRQAVKQVASIFSDEAAEVGIDLDEIAGHDPDGNGPVSTRFLLSATNDIITMFLRNWLGSVKVVARSERRSKADRKNWFVGVFEDKTVGAAPAVIDAVDVDFQAITAGGPGGQHQNKTASAIRARHRPTGMAVVVRSERSQHRNKAEALQRLANLISLDEVQKKVAADRTSWGSRIDVVRGAPVRVIE